MHDKPIPGIGFHYCSSLWLKSSPPRFFAWLALIPLSLFLLQLKSHFLKGGFPQSCYQWFPSPLPSPAHSFIALITICSWIMHCVTHLLILYLLHRMKPVLIEWYYRYSLPVSHGTNQPELTQPKSWNRVQEALLSVLYSLSCWCLKRSRSPEGGVGIFRVMHVNKEIQEVAMYPLV